MAIINSNAKHIILDFETVGNGQKNPSCAVPSLGVIVYEPSEVITFTEQVNRGLRLKFNLAEQFSHYERTYDQDTIDFWKKPENAEAYQQVIVPSANDVSLSELGSRLHNYLNYMGYSFEDAKNGGMVWCRGPAFDFPILSNIYDYFGWEEPFPFWAIRDLRTNIDDICSIWNPNNFNNGYVDEFGMPEGFIPHIDTHDCARDILMQQYNYMKLYEHLATLQNNQ